jgi:hypothetical protein
VQAAEDAAGGSLSQQGSSLLAETCGKAVMALAYLPRWCPQVVDSAYLALVRLKLSCQATVSRLLAIDIRGCRALQPVAYVFG